MRNAVIMPALLALLLVVACGCFSRAQPYKCCSDLGQAYRQAELVVSGHVTAANTLAYHPGPEVKTEAFGVIGSECVSDVEVTMNVDSTQKGNPPQGPLSFVYNAPCFEPKQGFTKKYVAEALVKGDKAKVYLVKHGQTWYMIAHELKSASFTNEAAESVPNP